MADRFNAAGTLIVIKLALATKVVEKTCTQLGITAATEAQLIKKKWKVSLCNHNGYPEGPQ